MKIETEAELFFFPLKDYPNSTKKEIRTILIKEGYINISYSGKNKGFYTNKLN